MNFEQIETLWAGQPPASFPRSDAIAWQRTFTRELNRRRRMFGYEIGALGFCLIVYPWLSFANARYAPELGTGLFWLNVAAHVLLMGTLFAWAVRRRQRHRQLMRKRAENLRQQTEVALASVQAEMSELRATPWVFGLSFGLMVCSVLLNEPFHGGSVAAIGGRVGGALVFYAVIGAVLWRHYRKNLVPAQRNQQEILRQLT